MLWLSLLAAAFAVALWIWIIQIPRWTAELDRRARLQLATTYQEISPEAPGESEDEFMSRVHRHILETLGLPPIRVVRIWLKTGKPLLLPHSDTITSYMGERRGASLADGRPDERITNGQGTELVKLLRVLGR